jgi:hypothetical protein
MGNAAPDAKRVDLRNGVLLLLAGWLIGAGIFVFFFLIPWVDHGDWQKTDATVTKVAIIEAPFGSADECQGGSADKDIMMLAVTYTYDVDGTSFVSDQFTHEYRGHVTCTKEEAAQKKAKYDNIGRVTVHYDPAHPSSAVVHLPDPLVIVVFGPILAILLVLIIGWYVSRRGRLKVQFP